MNKIVIGTANFDKIYGIQKRKLPKKIINSKILKILLRSKIKFLDTAFDYDDIAYFAAEYLLETYLERLMERYKLKEKPRGEEELIAAIGRTRGCVRSGGQVDMHKASVILINEIRGKILGGITFEMPENIEKENAHFAELEAKRVAAREAKKLARGRGRKNKR